MAKMVDITDKLNFEEKPVIKIKETELKVNNDADSMLKMIDALSGDTDDAKIVSKCIPLLFDAADRKKLEKLKLSFADYAMAIRTAIDLAKGDSSPSGSGR